VALSKFDYDSVKKLAQNKWQDKLYNYNMRTAFINRMLLSSVGTWYKTIRD